MEGEMCVDGLYVGNGYRIKRWDTYKARQNNDGDTFAVSGNTTVGNLSIAERNHLVMPVMRRNKRKRFPKKRRRQIRKLLSGRMARECLL